MPIETIGDVFNVPANTIERTKIRPPAGVKWTITQIAVEQAETAKVSVYLTKEVDGTFLDVLLGEKVTPFIITDKRFLTHDIFVSIKTTTKPANVGFTGIKL